MAFQPKGLRRVTALDPVQVLVSGGWMRWSMVKEANQASIIHMPEVSQFLEKGSETDPFQLEPFKVLLGNPDEDDVDEEDRPVDPKAIPPEESDTDLTKQGEPTDTDVERPASGAFKSPWEAENGNSTDPATGGGSDDTFVTKLVDDEPTLVEFNEAWEPRAQALGQAVLDQTVEFVRADIVAMATSLKADTEEMVTNTVMFAMSEVDKKLESFSPKQTQPEGTQVIVRVDIHKPAELKEVEGLAHMELPRLMKYVASGQHTYLPGPPGSSKSHSAQQVARGLGWHFGSISLGPTTPESRLWGGMDANGKFHEPAMIECIRYASDNPDSGAIFCLDELDNGHPGIIATVNSLLANGWVTLPNGETLEVGPNFVTIGCANTFGTGPTAEFAGRNRLDAATLDRFAYLPWDTDKGLERALVVAHLADTENGSRIAGEWLQVWSSTRINVEKHGLKVFVSMRGAINGAKLLAMGEAVDVVWGAVLGNKLPDDQRRKVNPL